jgi:hypothetical protein
MQQVRSLENDLLAKKFKESIYYLKNLRSNRYKRKTYRHLNAFDLLNITMKYFFPLV